MRHRLSAPTLLLFLVAIFTLTTGFSCNNAERNTFNTLAASKAVIDKAADDYNSGAIPATQVNRDLIERARAVQNSAVQAFHAYEAIKQAGGSKSDLDAANAKVEAALQELIGLQKQLEAIPRAFGEPGKPVQKTSRADQPPYMPQPAYHPSPITFALRS